jgi:hypothetical protein
MMKLTERKQRIINVFSTTGSLSKTGRALGISRQYVYLIVSAYKKGLLKYHVSPGYKDTGCLDGQYPSCLNCPLARCKYDDEGDL